MKRLTQKLSQPRALPLVVFMLIFALVGVVMLFQSFAAGNSTISGVAFKDMDRNGVQDAGEEPMAGHIIYLFDNNDSFVVGVATDATGRYSFSEISDTNYTVKYSNHSWQQIWEQWAPTTVTEVWPSQQVALVGNATANFGWRPITQSTDVNRPISAYTASDGLRIEIFNDAVAPQEINATLRQGTLIGQEASITIIRFALGTSSYCATTSGGSFSATCYVSYRSWLSDWDMTLFHEYGHAWAGFYSHRNNDPDLTGYLAARNLTGDPRLESSHAWSRGELIAEDYRQLFGSANAASKEQENREIPLASEVPGLREYLRGTFTSTAAPPPPSGIATPTDLSGNGQLTPEGPAVQLNWTASSGTVDHYDIYRNNVRIGYVNSPSSTYYDGANLLYNTTYSYYVKAVGTTGQESPASSTVSVTTPAPDTQKPSAPSGLMSTGATNSSISLQWIASSDNVGIKEYRIYQDSRKLQGVLKGTATGTNFMVTGLKSNTGHTFYVTAVDAAGNESLPSKVLSVKTKR